MQNYKVQPGHSLILNGTLLREGSVIPEWHADRDGGLKGRLANGCLAPTAEAVSVAVAPPVAKTADDPTPGLLAEGDRLARENAEYARSNKELSSRVAGLAAENDRLVAALGKATADAAHLAAACEDHQSARDALESRVAGLESKVAELTAELESATDPTSPDA